MMPSRIRTRPREADRPRPDVEDLVSERLRPFGRLASDEATYEMCPGEPADGGNQDGDDDRNGFAELIRQEPLRRNDHYCECDDCSEYRAESTTKRG